MGTRTNQPVRSAGRRCPDEFDLTKTRADLDSVFLRVQYENSIPKLLVKVAETDAKDKQLGIENLGECLIRTNSRERVAVINISANVRAGNIVMSIKLAEMLKIQEDSLVELSGVPEKKKAAAGEAADEDERQMHNSFGPSEPSWESMHKISEQQRKDAQNTNARINSGFRRSIDGNRNGWGSISARAPRAPAAYDLPPEDRSLSPIINRSSVHSSATRQTAASRFPYETAKLRHSMPVGVGGPTLLNNTSSLLHGENGRKYGIPTHRNISPPAPTNNGNSKPAAPRLYKNIDAYVNQMKRQSDGFKSRQMEEELNRYMSMCSEPIRNGKSGHQAEDFLAGSRGPLNGSNEHDFAFVDLDLSPDFPGEFGANKSYLSNQPKRQPTASSSAKPSLEQNPDARSTRKPDYYGDTLLSALASARNEGAEKSYNYNFINKEKAAFHACGLGGRNGKSSTTTPDSLPSSSSSDFDNEQVTLDEDHPMKKRLPWNTAFSANFQKKMSSLSSNTSKSSSFDDTPRRDIRSSMPDSSSFRTQFPDEDASKDPLYDSDSIPFPPKKTATGAVSRSSRLRNLEENLSGSSSASPLGKKVTYPLSDLRENNKNYMNINDDTHHTSSSHSHLQGSCDHTFINESNSNNNSFPTSLYDNSSSGRGVHSTQSTPRRGYTRGADANLHGSSLDAQAPHPHLAAEPAPSFTGPSEAAAERAATQMPRHSKRMTGMDDSRDVPRGGNVAHIRPSYKNGSPVTPFPPDEAQSQLEPKANLQSLHARAKRLNDQLQANEKFSQLTRGDSAVYGHYPQSLPQPASSTKAVFSAHDHVLNNNTYDGVNNNGISSSKNESDSGISGIFVHAGIPAIPPSEGEEEEDGDASITMTPRREIDIDNERPPAYNVKTKEEKWINAGDIFSSKFGSDRLGYENRNLPPLAATRGAKMDGNYHKVQEEPSPIPSMSDTKYSPGPQERPLHVPQPKTSLSAEDIITNRSHAADGLKDEMGGEAPLRGGEHFITYKNNRHLYPDACMTPRTNESKNADEQCGTLRRTPESTRASTKEISSRTSTKEPHTPRGVETPRVTPRMSRQTPTTTPRMSPEARPTRGGIPYGINNININRNSSSAHAHVSARSHAAHAHTPMGGETTPRTRDPGYPQSSYPTAHDHRDPINYYSHLRASAPLPAKDASARAHASASLGSTLRMRDARGAINSDRYPPSHHHSSSRGAPSQHSTHNTSIRQPCTSSAAATPLGGTPRTSISEIYGHKGMTQKQPSSARGKNGHVYANGASKSDSFRDKNGGCKIPQSATHTRLAFSKDGPPPRSAAATTSTSSYPKRETLTLDDDDFDVSDLFYKSNLRNSMPLPGPTRTPSYHHVHEDSRTTKLPTERTPDNHMEPKFIYSRFSHADVNADILRPKKGGSHDKNNENLPPDFKAKKKLDDYFSSRAGGAHDFYPDMISSPSRMNNSSHFRDSRLPPGGSSQAPGSMGHKNTDTKRMSVPLLPPGSMQGRKNYTSGEMSDADANDECFDEMSDADHADVVFANTCAAATAAALNRNGVPQRSVPVSMSRTSAESKATHATARDAHVTYDHSRACVPPSTSTGGPLPTNLYATESSGFTTPSTESNPSSLRRAAAMISSKPASTTTTEESSVPADSSGPSLAPTPEGSPRQVRHVNVHAFHGASRAYHGGSLRHSREACSGSGSSMGPPGGTARSGEERNPGERFAFSSAAGSRLPASSAPSSNIKKTTTTRNRININENINEKNRKNGSHIKYPTHTHTTSSFSSSSSSNKNYAKSKRYFTYPSFASGISSDDASDADASDAAYSSASRTFGASPSSSRRGAPTTERTTSSDSLDSSYAVFDRERNHAHSHSRSGGPGKTTTTHNTTTNSRRHRRTSERPFERSKARTSNSSARNGEEEIGAGPLSVCRTLVLFTGKKNDECEGQGHPSTSSSTRGGNGAQGGRLSRVNLGSIQVEQVKVMPSARREKVSATLIPPKSSDLWEGVLLDMTDLGIDVMKHVQGWMQGSVSSRHISHFITDRVAGYLSSQYAGLGPSIIGGPLGAYVGGNTDGTHLYEDIFQYPPEQTIRDAFLFFKLKPKRGTPLECYRNKDWSTITIDEVTLQFRRLGLQLNPNRGGNMREFLKLQAYMEIVRSFCCPKFTNTKVNIIDDTKLAKEINLSREEILEDCKKMPKEELKALNRMFDQYILRQMRSKSEMVDLMAKLHENAAYSILGVDPSATDEEIKKAYRTLSLTMHPDKGGKKGEFQEISNAFQKIMSQRHPSDHRKKDFEEPGAGSGDATPRPEKPSAFPKAKARASKEATKNKKKDSSSSSSIHSDGDSLSDKDSSDDDDDSGHSSSSDDNSSDDEDSGHSNANSSDDDEDCAGSDGSDGSDGKGKKNKKRKEAMELVRKVNDAAEDASRFANTAADFAQQVSEASDTCKRVAIDGVMRNDKVIKKIAGSAVILTLTAIKAARVVGYSALDTSTHGLTASKMFASTTVEVTTVAATAMIKGFEALSQATTAAVTTQEATDELESAYKVNSALCLTLMADAAQKAAICASLCAKVAVEAAIAAKEVSYATAKAANAFMDKQPRRENGGKKKKGGSNDEDEDDDDEDTAAKDEKKAKKREKRARKKEKRKAKADGKKKAKEEANEGKDKEEEEKRAKEREEARKAKEKEEKCGHDKTKQGTQGSGCGGDQDDHGPEMTRLNNLKLLSRLNVEILGIQKSLKSILTQNNLLIPKVTKVQKEDKFNLVAEYIAETVEMIDDLHASGASCPDIFTEICRRAPLSSYMLDCQVAIPIEIVTKTLRAAQLLDCKLLWTSIVEIFDRLEQLYNAPLPENVSLIKKKIKDEILSFVEDSDASS